MRSFNERAIDVLRERLGKLVEYHLRLEELCEDKDYVKASVKMADHFFWLDQDRAWPWLMARYVEGLAFSSPLREGLLETMAGWRAYLDDRGRKRLHVLEQAERYSWRSNELEARRRLLEDDAERGWLAERWIDNRHEEERHAIRHYSAADALKRADRHVEALESLQLAWRRIRGSKSGLHPQISKTAVAVGYQFYLVKDHPGARDAESLAVDADPDNHHAWRNLGSSYSLLKDYEKAIEHHQKAIALKPDDHDAWRNLGIGYSWLKDHEKAIEHYQKAIALKPDDHHAWRLLGISLSFLGHYEEAAAKLQRVLDAEDSDASAWNSRGYLHMIQGEKDLAVQAFERSIAADPAFPNPHAIWGHLLYREGEWDAAAEKYRTALVLDPRSPAVSLGLLALHRLFDLPGEPSTLWADTERLIEEKPDPMLEAQWLALNGEDHALEKLAEAIRQTPNDAVDARFRPAFHNLRTDPRFLELTTEAPGSTWPDLESGLTRD